MPEPIFIGIFLTVGGLISGMIAVLNTYLPDISQGDCSICVQEMYSAHDLDTLPCGHIFHEICIDEWYFKEGKTSDRLSCPLCRKMCRVRHIILNYMPLIEKNPL